MQTKIIILRGNSGSGKTETLLRHKAKSNANEFGEAEMKSWWKEKDYINIISEQMISKDMTADEIVDMILQEIEA